MVTGRPPFLGDDAVAVISQHINTMPVDPSWHEPSVPKPLEALIQRLLAKSPEERPGAATDVAQELRRILERTTQEPPAAPQPQVVTDLRALPWGYFVGRRDEIDQLRDALEGALSGKGALAMLVGEPGIGKTRLAEEFGVYAGLRGAQVLTGRCYEGESSLPYRPFMEALRQYVRSRRDDELRQQMGPGAPEMATLVSEIRQRFPEIEEAPKLEAEAERLRLFESVTAFLRNAAAGSPLVVHLDDLHWADKPSLLLLQHIARHTGGDRLLLVGAYRDVELDRSHPLAEALAVLRRLPNYRRVLLRGMSPEIVQELLASMEPSEAAAAGRQALAAILHQETEGNPLFIREVLAHLIETEKLVREGGRWVLGRVTSVSDLGIPEGVREVIGRRLSHLSEGCNRMLTLASTMTGGFTWEALTAINVDAAESGLLDSLEEALAAQVIAERRDAPGTYDFTHALIRQTLYEELSTPRRVLLHRQIGGALEQLYAANMEPHLAELAHHFYQAAPGGDVQKAIEYARRAADRAASLYAWEEAAEHYQRALQATDLVGTADEQQRVDLLMALGAAQSNLSPAVAMSTYERAALAAKAAGLVEQQAICAAEFASASGDSDPFGDRTQAVALLEDALAALPAEDSAARAFALGRLASAEYFTAPREKVAGLARTALAMARRIGDPPTLLTLLGAAHFALFAPDTADERIALADELFALASASGDKAAVLEAYFYRRGDRAELGDIDGAQRDIETSLALAGELRDRGNIRGASAALVTKPLLEGRFDEAEHLMQQALALGEGLQAEGPIIIFGAQLAVLRQLQGRLAEVEPLIRTQIEQYPHIIAYRCALGWIHGETGRTEEARNEFDELATHSFADLPQDGIWLISIYLLTELCGHLGDAERAKLLYDILLPYAGRNILTGNPALCTGSASRQLGMMAAVMGRYDDAERHFDDALAFDQKMNARPWVAHTQYQYAKMLVARDAPGDKAKALALLQQALNTAQELGMAKIIERGLALKLEAQGALSSSVYTSIEAVARAVHDERPALPQQALAPDGTVTIMFSDIEDSTVLTERLGDQAWMELLRKHDALIREQLRAYDGFEVKTIGDAFMVAFRSAKKGLECAIAIQRAFGDGKSEVEGGKSDGEVPPPTSHLSPPVKVRIGLHAGEAIKDGDDFYGKNVILASRVAGKAVGGEILVSSLVRALVESSVDAGTFGEPREVELKGLTGSHALYAVRWA